MKKMKNNVHTLLLTTLFLSLLAPQGVLAYQAAPIAVTMSATFITEKSAQVNGQANPGDMPDAYSWFEWGLSGRPGIVFETPHYAIGGQNTLIDRNAVISGLAPETQYFYRQVVENGRGKDRGQTVYFTTKPLAIIPPPIVIVETQSHSAVTDTTVTLKGYISPHQDRETKASFQWGITRNFENQTPFVGVSSDAGPTEVRLNNLTPGTTYFYRVVAQNSTGRTFGATQIFITTGTPPLPPEQPINQSVPTPVSANDGVNRTTTTSGATGTQVSSGSGLPGITSENRPGDIFGFFRKKSAPPTSTTNSPDQVAGVAQAGNSTGGFWGNLTGKGAAQVTIEKVGPKKVVVHTPVEYRITYSYKLPTPASNAKLKIILPGDVVYIGDNTNNELLIEEGNRGERTYILPIGRMEKDSTRTLSVLGMTTGDAVGFPDARARLEYDGPNGIQVVGATTGEGTPPVSRTAASGNSDGWLPSSFFGWLLYLLLVVLSIIGIRKGMVYYKDRKTKIELEEEADDRGKLARLLPQSKQTPQGA